MPIGSSALLSASRIAALGAGIVYGGVNNAIVQGKVKKEEAARHAHHDGDTHASGSRQHAETGGALSEVKHQQH